MSFSRQIAQINSVTRNSENGSYNTGSNSNYNRSKGESEKVLLYDIIKNVETRRSKTYKNSRSGRRRSPTPIPELDESFDHSERDYDTRTSIRSYHSRESLNSYESFKGKASYPLLSHLS